MVHHPFLLRRPALSLRARGIAALTVPMLALFSALFAICWMEHAAQDADLVVARTYETRATLLQLRILLLDAAAGDYLAVGENRSLASYGSVRQSVNKAVARLSSLVQDDPPSVAILGQIKRESDEELAILAHLNVAPYSSRSALLQSSGKLIGIVGSRLLVMDEAQQLRLFQASYNRDVARQELFRVVIACGILGPLGALFVSVMITGRMVRRLRAVGENARRLAMGLPLDRSPEGADEIADLARQQHEAASLLLERELGLRESERRYRELFERAPIAYDEIDREGAICKFNEAVCATLKCAPADLLGRKAWDFLYPEVQAAYRESLLGRIAAGTESTPYECDYLLGDGMTARVEIRENILRDEHGNPVGVCRSLLDVTERHLAAVAASKAEQYSLELHNKVQELAEALNSARSAAAAKGRFLAGVSHELRTPLNAIIGFSELLQDGRIGEVSEQQREILEDILIGARHLLSLINDILDISKIEAGKMEFRPERVDIAALVKEVLDVVRPLADKKDIRLSSAAPVGVTGLIDATRFKQVLYNYLSNAVKFTPDRGQVMLRVEPKGNAALRIEVEDTGIGIAPEEIPQLFQEFHQLSARKADQGTGLGLALTRRIVEAQGGHVEVRSSVGRGSIFAAELPIGPQAAASA
jgi:PAS domain S-box-containing protein